MHVMNARKHEFPTMTMEEKVGTLNDIRQITLGGSMEKYIEIFVESIERINGRTLHNKLTQN